MSAGRALYLLTGNGGRSQGHSSNQNHQSRFHGVSPFIVTPPAHGRGLLFNTLFIVEVHFHIGLIGVLSYLRRGIRC